MAAAEGTYDLGALSAPVLSGALLRHVFVPLLEAPLLGRPLRRRLFAANRFDVWRDAFPAASLADAPRVRYPLHPPPDASAAPHCLAADSVDADRRAFVAALDDLFLAATAGAVAAPVAGVPDRFDSVRALHEGYAAGTYTPDDVVAALLERIKASNAGDGADRLNAIGDFDEAALRAEAAASTARWRAGKPLSCLDGVPVAFKQALAVRGLKTSAGIGYLLKDAALPAAEADGGAAEAFRTVGALCSMHCCMDEMGVGVRGFNAHIPGHQVRNPVNKGRVAGGSSGGSAAAVAAGLCPIAIGTDGGGSVRIPAAACCVYGLKATFGRIGSHGMAEEVAGAPGATLHVGPIAANLCDLNYAYHILSCFAPQRPIASRPDWNASVPLSLPLSLRAAKSSLAGVRVGIFTPWLEDAHEDLVQACRVTLKALEDEHGAVAKEVVVPGLEHCRVGHAVSIIRDMRAACARAGVFDAGPGGEKKFQLGLDARAKLAVAADFTDDDERRSEVVRARAMTAVVDGVFSAVDILLTPTLGAPPPPVPRNLDTGELNVAADSAAMRFALLGNVTGVPAVTVPVGEPDAATGFRASVQLMGAPWCEDLLMRVAACCT